jgi:hypothetical protein
LKHARPKLMTAFGLTLAIVLTAHAVSARPAVAPSELPAVLQSCLDPGFYYELVGRTTQSADYYYLRTANYPSEFSPLDDWYTLVRVASGQCSRLQDHTSAQAPLSRTIPIQAARQLELQRFEAEIAALGGKSAFEAQLDRMLNPEPHTYFEGVTIYLSDEQIWALQQLGVRFSNNYQRLN